MLDPTPVVDVHGHVGAFAGYDLSDETLLAEVEGGGIGLILVSNIDAATVPGRTAGLPQLDANLGTLERVRRWPDRLRGLLWIRPDEGAPEILRPLLEERVSGPAWGSGATRLTSRAFVGIKLHPEMNVFAADAPEVDPCLDFAAEHHLPVVIHCDGSVDEASAERIGRLGRRHPEVPIVLYHMGFGGPHEPAIRTVEAARDKGDADLYLETSQVPPTVAVAAVERVGPERVLFGTDATYFGRGHYDRYRPLVEGLRRALEPEAFERVMRANGLTLFRLLDTEPGTDDRTP